MKKEIVSKMANMREFTPYHIAIVDEYRTSPMSWLGIGSHKVDIWGLFYEDTEITRGGKTYIEKMKNIANGAYNLGMIESLKLIE
jgi:hypothetical protein